MAYFDPLLGPRALVFILAFSILIASTKASSFYFNSKFTGKIPTNQFALTY